MKNEKVKRKQLVVSKMNHSLEGKQLWALVNEYGMTVLQIYSKEYPTKTIEWIEGLMNKEN